VDAIYLRSVVVVGEIIIVVSLHDEGPRRPTRKAQEIKKRSHMQGPSGGVELATIEILIL